MGKYKFSTREKVLLVCLVALLVLLLWYQLFYVPTQEHLSDVEQQISEVQDEALTDTVKSAKMRQMQDKVEAYKKQGRTAAAMPSYDNGANLTRELDKVLGNSTVYSMSFEVDDGQSDSTASSSSSSSQGTSQSAGTDSSVVTRVMSLSFGCSSYKRASAVLDGICDGPYPCSLDSFTITDNKSSRKVSSGSTSTVGSGVASGSEENFSVTMQVTFYESKS
ncbi:MAG: hypothetical protein ACOX69_02130 [Coriobacteriales bacterium]|jgi:hypothetical protein